MATSRFETFGDRTPFAEPLWYRNGVTSYYNETHVAFRAQIRAFVDKEIAPFVDDWEERHLTEGFEVPLDLYRRAHAAGIFSPQYPKELGGTPPPGGKFDCFHDLVLNDELVRCCSGGVSSGFVIYTMALNPILAVGPAWMREYVARPVICAEKFIALCVSEPSAGSDVAALRTTAVREGDNFVVNGQKKWITWGIHADFFTVAVRTGGAGAKGVSLLLIERGMKGVKVERMKLQGQWLGGTSVVTFEDVRVPVRNLIGEENNGFRQIMSNFNHERFIIAVQGNRCARACIAESFKYALQRETFGKRLIEHQIIRAKLFEMASRVESNHAMIESLCFQMQNGMGEQEIGAVIAMLKVSCSRTLELCSREAAQIFGGASYVRGGKGVNIERIAREVRAVAIPGGSEEIMAELALKLSMKEWLTSGEAKM